MANNEAWAGLGNAISEGQDAYSKAKAAKAAMAAAQIENALKQSQTRYYDAGVGKRGAETGKIEGQAGELGSFDATGKPTPPPMTTAPASPAALPPPPIVNPDGPVPDAFAAAKDAAKDQAPAPGAVPVATPAVTPIPTPAPLANPYKDAFRAPTPGEPKGQYRKEHAAWQAEQQKEGDKEKLKKTAGGGTAGNSGKMTIDGQTFTMKDLNAALKPQERLRWGAVPTGLAAHNQLVDLYQAYQDLGGAKGNVPPSTMETIGRQFIAKHPDLSSLAQGDMKSNIAALYDSAKANSAGETYKIRNGSTATPTDQGYQHLLGLYPNLADDPVKAQGQFNQYYNAQLVPNIAGLQTVMQGLGTHIGASGKPEWHSQVHKAIYNNLGSTLKELTSGTHNLRQFQTQNGEAIVPGLPGGGQAPVKVPAVGTIEDGHRFKGGNPADPNSWEPVQ